MDPIPYFARIRLFAGGMYVVRAQGLAPSIGGQTYTDFKITTEIKDAQVYVGSAADEIVRHLRRLFSQAALENATYQEWIEQGSKTN